MADRLSQRFVRVPTELLEAMLRSRLNGSQWRIVFWVIRQTLGWNRNTARFSWYRIARELSMDRGGAVRAGRELLRSGVLFQKGNEIGVQRAPAAWTSFQNQPTMTNVIADARHRNAMTGVRVNDDRSPRKRCQESSLFRRAKDSCKDKSKTYKDRRSVSAANPIPGKYDGLSKN